MFYDIRVGACVRVNFQVGSSYGFVPLKRCGDTARPSLSIFLATRDVKVESICDAY